jgi:hypothetical protein
MNEISEEHKAFMKAVLNGTWLIRLVVEASQLKCMMNDR